MSEPSNNLGLPRRIRVSLGLLVGLIFAPLFAGILAQLPKSEWMGADPVDTGSGVDFVVGTSVILGLCLGPSVGLAVSVVALGFQVWWWPSS